MFNIYQEKGIKKLKTIMPNFDNEFIYSENYKYFILEEAGEIKAYSFIEKQEGRYYIKRIFVNESDRYKSVGTKLLNFMINWIVSKNKNTLYLEKQEEKNWNFFKKKGFIIKDEEIYISNLLLDKKRKREGIFGTVVSIIMNIILAILKVTFGIIGNSKALLVDGFHSLSDVVTSIVVLISIFIASKPADEKHPYGHGQIESISGNIVGVVLIFTAFELISDSVKSIIIKKEFIKPDIVTIYVVSFAIVVKYFLYIYKYNMGKRIKNAAIIADAKDHKSDVISSIGVLIGIFLALKVSPIFDTIAGFVVSLLIAKEGISIIKETSNKIMDAQETDVIESIKQLVLVDEAIYNIHDIVMKNSGDKLFLSFHIRVNKDMTVKESNILLDKVEEDIKTKYLNVKEIMIKVDPYRE